MSQQILIVEDDQRILNLIQSTLQLHTYDFLVAHNGQEALQQMVSKQPDLVVLDLGLPDLDGIEVIKRIRSWSQAHIIVVSARARDEDKVMALDAGADDYLTKPFSIDELLARVRVGFRRMKHTDDTNPIYENGYLRIDYQAQQVTLNGVEIHLTPIEYKLLVVMSKNEDKVLSHNFLLKEIWGHAIEEDLASLRVFMATLRKKIEPDVANPTYIQTHVSVGYRLKRNDLPKNV